MQPPPHIDELLTGLLDGNLSEGELRHLEAAMAADCTLEKQLETLRKMRSNLLIHRPKGRLGADFAKRVTALAEERARADAAHLAPKAAPKLRLAPWIYTGVASAAVVACIIVAMPSDSNVQPLVAKTNLPVEIEAATPAEIPPVGTLESQLGIAESKVAEGTFRKPNSPVVIKELEQANSLAGVLPPSPDDKVQKDEAQKKEVGSVPAQLENLDASNVASNSKDNIYNEKSLKNAKTKLGPNQLTKNMLTLVVDISLTKSAIDNEVLESILSRHDIAMTEQQILTAEEITNLEKTSLASKPVDDGSGEIGIIFIRAPGTNVNKAIADILLEENSFPQVGMDIQMDNSLKAFVTELSAIRVLPERKGQARHLRSTSKESRMSFAEGSKKLSPLRLKTEKSGMSAILNADSRAMSNALLIIRQAK
ncbi:MAG: hypothetical protein NTY15_02030 [Planctomycetota bacterium]|nr:hypothetical protein [Planctomycetota bacterium]